MRRLAHSLLSIKVWVRSDRTRLGSQERRQDPSPTDGTLGIPDPSPLGGVGYMGTLMTRTLLFFGHSGNRASEEPPVLCSFDKVTGVVLNTTELPVIPRGTPMTYIADERQYFVMAYGAGDDSGSIGLVLPTVP